MKQTAKRWTALAVAMAMMVVLAACGGDKPSTPANSGTPSPSSSQPAGDSGYPKEPVKVVCSWAAGGQADVVCRILTELLSQQLGVPVIVENVTGNGGQVAAIEYMQAEADGYTLLYTSDVVQFLAPRVAAAQYDPAQMIPLCTTASNGFGLIVNTDTGVTSLAELKSYADQTVVITVGVTGKTGAITYELLNALFQEMGVHAEFMVFDNGPAVAMEVVGKHIDCGIAIDPQCDPYVQDGSVNYIASFLEDGHAVEGGGTIPSVSSQGYQITCANPNMIVAKAGTDQAVLDTLVAALKNCQSDFEAKCAQLGYTPNMTFESDLTDYLAELDALYAAMAEGK